MRLIHKCCSALTLLGIVSNGIYTLADDEVDAFVAATGSTPSAVQDTTGYNPNDVKLLTNQEQLPMPYLSNLSSYKERASSESEGGSIEVWNGSAYVEVTTNGVYDGNGPDSTSGTEDDGTIILYGTKDNPIKINGLTVIDSDIIISGYYEGVGSIIGGRNLHIINNLVPVDEINWDKNGSDEEIQTEILENSDSSMICLAVKGCVVFGDVESTFNSCSSYMDCQPYSVDDSDSSIGYVTSTEDGVDMFHGDYSEWDGSYRSPVTLADVTGE